MFEMRSSFGPWQDRDLENMAERAGTKRAAEVRRAANRKAPGGPAAAAGEDRPEMCANARPAPARERPVFTRRNKRATNDCREAIDNASCRRGHFCAFMTRR